MTKDYDFRMPERVGKPIQEREFTDTPFLIRTEGSEWIPVAHKSEEALLLRTFVDLIHPALSSRRTSFLITDGASLIGHQALLEDKEHRYPLDVVNVLVETEPNGKSIREIAKTFLSLPLQDKKVTVMEHARDLSEGYEYHNDGLLLQAERFPLVAISERWRVSLPPEATENGELYNVSIELPTDEGGLFGHFTELEVQDMRSDQIKRSSYMNLSSPYLTRMMCVARAKPEDIAILKVLTRMGYFQGKPTLLPTGEEYADIERLLSHRHPRDREGLIWLDELKKRVSNSIQFRWTQRYYDLWARGEISKELEGLPSEVDESDKVHEWVVNSDTLNRHQFPERDYRIVPAELRSVEENNTYYIEKWIAEAERYEGGREKFWIDLFALSTKKFIQDQYINLDRIAFIDFLRADLTETFHQPEHTGNAIVNVCEIMEAMRHSAPEFVSSIQVNTAKAAGAAHDVIQESDFIEEELQFGKEKISRIKRKPRTGQDSGDNERESGEVFLKFTKFVNKLYENIQEDPIFDPQAGYDCILATAPVRHPDGRVEQTVFEMSRQKPEIQAVLLADLGPENGMAKRQPGIRELQQNSWGIIWEQEAEVKAAEFGYRLKKSKEGELIAVPFSKSGGDLTEAEKERLANIMKARMLGQRNLHNDIRGQEGGRAKIAEQISQMDPRVQDAMKNLFGPESRESQATLAVMEHYYLEMQELSFTQLLDERRKVFGRARPFDLFASTHTIPEDFPLYQIAKPTA